MNYESSQRKFAWKSRLVVAALAIRLLPMGTGDSFDRAVARAADNQPAENLGKEAKSAAPQIVKTVPERGAKEVDPDLKEIRVTFDRDMGAGMSWTGGPPHFPPLDASRQARWIDARTCVLPVRLQREAYYRLGINSTGNQKFRSRQGTPFAPAAIYFVTAGAAKEIVERVKAPTIVSVEPQNGAMSVDPNIKSLRVTFDRPMSEGMSWTGGGPSFPKLPSGEKPAWSADGLTCTLPVSLEAEHEYQLSLNSESHINFQSKWGVPLEPVSYKFRTGKAK